MRTIEEAQRREREGLFPCNHPRNYHMQDEDSRIASYCDWPGDVAATTRQLAQSGLYYLGISDKTKCFYCGGGLENWEYNDDPDHEHAKWFPECEFMLRKKGVEYVARISTENPNLVRPTFHEATTIRTPGHVINLSNTMIMSTGGNVTVTRNGEPISLRPVAHQGGWDEPPEHQDAQVDPFEPVERPQRSLEERVQEAMNHDLTRQMIAFGFTEELIKKAIKRKLTSSRLMFETAEEFLDSIQREESEANESQNVSVAGPVDQPSLSNQGNAETQESSMEPNVQRRIQEIVNERRCKICLDEDASCVFEPCGHLCACLQCGRQLRSCPICRSRISSILRIYTA